jgi:transposase
LLVVYRSNFTATRYRKRLEKRRCELLYLPPYSPDLNPIGEAFSKVKSISRKAEVRTREALVVAMGAAISEVIARDTRGFFEHCGYGLSVQPLR